MHTARRLLGSDAQQGDQEKGVRFTDLQEFHGVEESIVQFYCPSSGLDKLNDTAAVI